MPTSVEYVTRETASNLWRNRLMTIAAVLTVAVSLSLVGAALLLRQGASHASSVWERQTQVTVWMKPGASSTQIKAVGAQLAQLSLVEHPCVYWDQQRDYQEALQLEENIIHESGTTVADIPSSWRCTPAALSSATAVRNEFIGQAGVHAVSVPEKAIHTEERAISIIQWIFIGLAVVLLGSAIVLILNTIRMAIFARRREVSVMKLVGATNWFIRVPFMSEGLVEGLLGSAVAAGAVYLLHWWITYLAHPGNLWWDLALSGWDAFWVSAVVVVVGAAVGTLGSFVAIRRFLDV
jgi:cell division transport system permease protein